MPLDGMDLGRSVLSKIIFFDKYARYWNHLNRRETFEECVQRNKDMHIRKYPTLQEDIDKAYELVLAKKVLPSMRSMQFGGKAIEITNTRIYNCSYLPVDDVHAFSEIMFLLLGGSGVGFSIQQHHVDKLPTIKALKKPHKYLIQDSIEGWADAIKVLMRAYFEGRTEPRFDFSAIRPRGARLVTSGGKAPGPEPLRICLTKIDTILASKQISSKLTPFEAHEIICLIADAVLAGGIRRAALISLFDRTDLDMLYCKSGDWFELKPHLARANNSAVFPRGEITEEEFNTLWSIISSNKTGEPGIFFTNDKNVGTNPCIEASLNPHTFCNLTTINAYLIKSQKDLEEACWAASLIGTLQASYTDFHYLRPIWKEETEKDALIGVSITGLATEEFLTLDLTKAAQVVVNTNKTTAQMIGINSAARTTLVKPEGTSSSFLGTGSGIHPWHGSHYIRRFRIGKNQDLYWYLLGQIPDLIEDDAEKPHLQAIVSIPIKAPESAITRQEGPISLLNRMKDVYDRWIIPGWNRGINSHTVSLTVSIKDDEWETVGKWLWRNRRSYSAVATLPYDLGTYKQPPFEEISSEKYEKLSRLLEDINLSYLKESDDNTDLTGEIACQGNSCQIV